MTPHEQQLRTLELEMHAAEERAFWKHVTLVAAIAGLVLHIWFRG